jgi:pyruvate formate lyase activating enzyme
MAELLSDRPFWTRSGGGVTLSGGEPLMQPEFSKALLAKCHESYIHTALETCLCAPEEVLESIADYVDFFMCDLKVVDEKRHKELTGISNRLILSNLARLLGGSKPLLVRMPLVPGWNDDRENLEQTGRFLESHRKGVELELLPYHRYGEAKYERLGLNYSLAEVVPPTPAEMARALDVLGAYNIRLVRQ